MFLFTDFRLARLYWLLSLPLVSQNDKNSRFSLMESVLKKQCANQHCLELGCTLLTANSAPTMLSLWNWRQSLGPQGLLNICILRNQGPGLWSQLLKGLKNRAHGSSLLVL